MKKRTVLVRFDTTTGDEHVIRLDGVHEQVRRVELTAVSFAGVSTGLVTLRIDGVSSDIATEGLQGVPIPLIQQSWDGAFGFGGSVFPVPIVLGHPNRGGMKDLRVRAKPFDESQVLMGVGANQLTRLYLWIDLICDEPHTMERIAAPDRAVGINDWRFDWTPTAEEQARHMARMQNRFSNRLEQ